VAVVEIHTGIISSPKHAPLSADAFRLWLNGLCWSKEHLTDGFIPAVAMPILHRKAIKFVSELLETLVIGKGPLWHEVPGGYQIHDYEQWQETKARVQERRQQWRDRKNRQRDGVNVPRDVTPNVTRTVPRESRVSPAKSPSDGSGGGRGIKKIPPTPKGVDALFDRFWQAYPRRIGKGSALKAWNRLNPDVDLFEAMIAAIGWQQHQDAWTKDGGAFIPHPSTWLNARRWEDEHPGDAINGVARDEPVAAKWIEPYQPKTREIPGW
jgi:hypothetical protein